MKQQMILRNLGLATCVALTGFLTVSIEAASKGSGNDLAISQFKAANQKAVMLHNQAGGIRALYAPAMSHGGTPFDSARNYISEWGDMHGITLEEIRPIETIEEVPLQYDRETGDFGMTLFNFEQTVSGIPVYDTRLMTLVKNEPGYPVIHVKSDLKSLKGWTPGPIANDAVSTTQALKLGSKFLGEKVTLVNEPSLVVFAGGEQVTEDPVLCMSFEITAGSKSDDTFKKWLLLTEVGTGQVVYQQNLILNCGMNCASVAQALGNMSVGDVSGQTSSLATDGSGADICETESFYGMPHIFVSGSNGQNVTADANGNWTMPSSGDVTVSSSFSGQYFVVNNDAGSEASFSTSVSNGGTASLQNTDTSEYVLAEANAYLHLNLIRDFVLSYNPNYPVISTQTQMPANVNLGSSCNAYYDGGSTNYYIESGGCSNTSFSVIIHHEYGHHLVNTAGSGQNEYGEGMGDVMSVLMSGDPQLARGFFTNDCNSGIRNADNNCQYQASGCSSCGSAIHSCGQLISGVVWDLLELMPDDFDTAARIVIDSLPLHDGTSIDGAILLDYLILDDDDGDLSNGTPNSDKIYNAFGQHGITEDNIPTPPDNDDCVTAREVTWGSWEVNTTGAASSGVAVDANQCADTYMTACDPDVWYRLVACGTGSMTVSLCSSATFDTDLAVYTGDCSGLSQIACNGDAANCDTYTSSLSVDVTQGQSIFVRVGGFNGATGTGTVIIDGPGDPCDDEVITFDFPGGLPDVIDPNDPPTISITLEGTGDLSQVPGSGRMYVSQSGTVVEGTMQESGPNGYFASFPPLACQPVTFWFEVEGTNGTTYGSGDKTAEVYSDSEVIFQDNGDIDSGWVVGGDATDGQWDRGVPVNCSRCDPPTDRDGTGGCWLTDNSSANTCNSDVDGGSTILTTPVMDTSDSNAVVNYSRWYSNGSDCNGGSPQADTFVVEASANGIAWTTIEIVGPTGPETSGGWFDKTFVVADLPGSFNSPTFRLRFTASDLASGSVIEAAIDNLSVTVTTCNDSNCVGDITGDGYVGVDDLLAVIADWNNPYTVDDLLGVIADWNCN